MEISKEERELYDRQIRLWGIEGQNTLRNSRILLIGFEAVAVEVVKNLCLAGVGSLTLQSTRIISKEDFEFNFFIRQANIGENAAEASVIGLQRLNPRVVVQAETTPIEQLNDDYFKNYNVVVVSQTENKHELIRINNACRSNNTAFYYCNIRGWAGMLFVDLGAQPFTFMEEKEVVDKISKPGKLTKTKEIVHVSPPSDGTTKEKLTVKETYCSLESTLNASENFAAQLKVRQRARVSQYLPAFLSLLNDSNGVDISVYAKKLGLENLAIKPNATSDFINWKGIQISAIAAVIAGLLSQEVLNFLTAKEAPIQNVLIYDALEGKGPVYHVSSQ